MIANQISINASAMYQPIIGFGGSFTDASGINIAKLSPATQDLLLRYNCPQHSALENW